MFTRGIRGAITVDENTADSIKESTVELFQNVMMENNVNVEDISYILFTMTKDLNAAFPAKFARENFDIKYVPLMNVNELDVHSSLEKCLRLLMVVNTQKSQQEIRHVYLKGAKILRPDIV